MGLHLVSEFKKIFFAASAMALVLFVGSCGRSSSSRVYLIDESRTVTGGLLARNGFDPKNVLFSVIDSNGLRKTPAQFVFDAGSNSFSMELSDESFYDIQKATVIERMLSMGNKLPIFGLTETQLVGRTERYVRFEVRPERLSDDDFQVVPYLQTALPLSRKNLYAGNDSLKISGQLEMGKAGFVKVTVRDEEGQPIPNARVAAVSEGSLVGDYPLWHDPQLRPVFSQTDASGIAFVGPIDAATVSSYFQLLVVAESYCHYLSAPSHVFSLLEAQAPQVSLRSCAQAQEGKNELLVSFPKGLKYLDVKDTASGVSRKVVHTNDSSILIRLDSSTENFRGLLVSVYETSKDFEPIRDSVVEKTFLSFEGEVELPLPKIFTLGNSQDGSFSIEVSRLPGEKDGNQLSTEEFPIHTIYGSKRVLAMSRDALMNQSVLTNFKWALAANATPPLAMDYWSNVFVKGAGGFQNVVSGLTGQTFTITSPLCEVGYELGFEAGLLGIGKIFRPCVDTVATFTSDEVGFPAKLDTIRQNGGRNEWKLYIKDKWGNESEPLESTSDPSKYPNVMTVLVDLGTPTLGSDSHPLANLEFVLDTDLSGNPTYEISRQDFIDGELSFRFQQRLFNGAGGWSDFDQELICNQVSATSQEKDLNGEKAGRNAIIRTPADRDFYIYKDELGRIWGRETDFSNPGLQFVKYALAANESSLLLKPLTDYSNCRSIDGTKITAVKTKLTSAHLSIPAQGSTGDAEFFLRVMDASGNLSLPTKYVIPSCASVVVPDGESRSPAETCWKQ